MKQIQVGLFVLVVTALGAAACASAGGGTPRSCELEPADSAFAAGGKVYRDCAVDTKVKLLTAAGHPDWSPPDRRDGCFSAEVEFVVDTAGRAERANIKVMHANDRALADAIVAMVPQLKYEAAVKDGAHVRQITTYRQAVQVGHAVVKQGDPPPTRPSSQRGPAC